MSFLLMVPVICKYLSHAPDYNRSGVHSISTSLPPLLPLSPPVLPLSELPPVSLPPELPLSELLLSLLCAGAGVAVGAGVAAGLVVPGFVADGFVVGFGVAAGF